MLLKIEKAKKIKTVVVERWAQPPILKTLVPHTGHMPLVAGLPFFRVTFCGSLISLFALHFTQ
jgi:hypothetical protein